MEGQDQGLPKPDEELRVDGWSAFHEPGSPVRYWVPTGNLESENTPPQILPVDLTAYHNTNDPFYKDFI